jgi:hypothetical protein
VSKPRTTPAPLTQQAFAFTSNAEAQEAAIAIEEQQRARLAYVLDHMKLSPVTLEIIKQPIFTRKGQSFLEQIEEVESTQVEIEYVFNKEPTSFDKAEDINAFLSNIPRFVACFLDRLLEGLADVGGVDDKIDTLEWMFTTDEAHSVWTEEEIAQQHVRQTSLPFTWCCKVLGLNPELLRDGVKESLDALLIEVDDKIRAGVFKPMRRAAIAHAVDCVNQRST